jgi:hypothetical protein
MKRPAALVKRPSVLMLTLGGAVATLLLSSFIFLAPVFGFPFIDFPRLVGGIFTEDPVAAAWLGFWLFFLTGWVVFPVPLSIAWTLLPGDHVGLSGALLKGVLWGLVLWALSGVLLPLFGWLNQLTDQGLENPGFFALEAGVLGALGILLGHLAYGVALALVASMGHGISPLELLGQVDYERSDMNRAASAGGR